MYPVDVIIKDSKGNEIGSIIGNTVKCSSDIIDIEKIGDMKIIYLLKQEDIEIKLNVTDNGYLNISVDDCVDDEKSKQSNFYDIPLNTYKELIVKSPYTDEDIESITINSTTLNGMVSGTGIYDKGSPVSLIAIPYYGKR